MMEFFFVVIYVVVNIGGMCIGWNVFIIGVGLVGLLVMVVVKGLGVGKVIVVDINEERLYFVK